MAVTKNSWVYKKMDGFGKNNSSGKIFYERGGRFAENGINYEFGGSANVLASHMTRPATAVDVRRSMPNICFDPFGTTSSNNDETLALIRPQTASASMLRAKADRTGKFFFQNKAPTSELTRKLIQVRVSLCGVLT